MGITGTLQIKLVQIRNPATMLLLLKWNFKSVAKTTLHRFEARARAHTHTHTHTQKHYKLHELNLCFKFKNELMPKNV